MAKILSTHVLDATTGDPAAGLHVRLESIEGQPIASAMTDADGRIPEIAPEGLIAATYCLVFFTGEYYDQRGQDTFYPVVTVTFELKDPQRGYHVPLLLSPFAYSTYRGS
ncbi:hydroxyisourate hydrolase [Rhodococcus tibetensis]|uniref:5-hydroxyisourate hydrolase n=1 Tax=Rhodococcus tibetensis TaxID=2965064 RepID=A0ABT1Q5V5_9NOCA|nr:hydroxyisourate hydrolase [Rhodococcus sp. FXJ9.536]MCQ4117639.1 hydroxyisourate hydrolase [Rhodococcus sp. FXJ9.536]